MRISRDVTTATHGKSIDNNVEEIEKVLQSISNADYCLKLNVKFSSC